VKSAGKNKYLLISSQVIRDVRLCNPGRWCGIFRNENKNLFFIKDSALFQIIKFKAKLKLRNRRNEFFTFCILLQLLVAAGLFFSQLFNFFVQETLSVTM
jgi:hypothetical protein